MDYQLKARTALVTGSTAGIGFAIAKLLAQEGATVLINGRTEERVVEAINKIKSVHSSAELIAAPGDLTDEHSIKKIISLSPEVDILVNNFGIYEIEKFTDISDEKWLSLFNANVLSGIRLSRHYLPKMLKNNWGRIIFISSESGVQIHAQMIHYSMTKSAQLAISRGLSEMTAGTEVTVNSVLPGPTSSEGVNRFIEQIAQEQAKSTEQIEKDFFESFGFSSLLKRFTTPEEVAALVVYLCSPLSSGTNGAALRVDGGVIKTI